MAARDAKEIMNKTTKHGGTTVLLHAQQGRTHDRIFPLVIFELSQVDVIRVSFLKLIEVLFCFSLDTAPLCQPDYLPIFVFGYWVAFASLRLLWICCFVCGVHLGNQFLLEFCHTIRLILRFEQFLHVFINFLQQFTLEHF